MILIRKEETDTITEGQRKTIAILGQKTTILLRNDPHKERREEKANKSTIPVM